MDTTDVVKQLPAVPSAQVSHSRLPGRDTYDHRLTITITVFGQVGLTACIDLYSKGACF
jgi:hypothetical protein